jgi:hypothetical protein
LELPSEGVSSSVLPPPLKLAQLVLPAPDGPLDLNEPAKTNPLDCPRGFLLASLASIVTMPGVPAAPPITSAP